MTDLSFLYIRFLIGIKISDGFFNVLIIEST